MIRKKILKILNEDYDIDRIEKSDNYAYARVDQVTYQLSGGNEIIVPIEYVTHTVENTFYPDHIKRYEDYIEDGGIIETFPVQVTTLSDNNNLKSMLEYLDEMESEDFDKYYDEFKTNMIYKLFYPSQAIDEEEIRYGEVLKYFEEIGGDIDFITDDHMGDDEREEFLKNNQLIVIDPLASSYQKLLGDNKSIINGRGVKEFLENYKYIFDWFDENKEYNLRNHNHRFAALKNLGKTHVYVEII